MRTILHLLLLLTALSAGPAAQAAGAGPSLRTDNVAASLVAEADRVRPGDSFWLALRFEIREGWHTYWRNPGDSGEPTRLDWTLPPGVAVSEIHWAYPEHIPVGPLANYGYEGEVFHLVEVAVPADWPQGQPLVLHARALWLVCEQICIPEEGELALEIPTGETVIPTGKAHLFGAARAKLPADNPWPGRFVRDGEGLRLAIGAGPDAARVREARFFPFEWGVTEPAAPQRLERHAEGFALAMTDKGAKGPLAGVLVLTEAAPGGDLTRAVTVSGEFGEPPAWLAAAPLAAPPADEAGGGLGLPQALLLALLGGVILNLMPCVFPVLSIKALSLLGHAADRRSARLGGLAYTGGILVFMAALAGLLIALRAGGAQIGWGFQLQEPGFVALMALVIFGLGLWLSGVVTLGGGVIGVGQGLAARPGFSGSFFTGALAALVATPCTAPFMGAAVGFALAQPWPVALSVMLALGLGLALPYLALSFAPGLVRLLPRPGPWMARLKQALAFPLYATAAWLVWVLAQQAGPEGVALALAGFVLLGFAAWLKGATERAERGWRIGGGLAAALVMVAALGLALAAPRAAGDGGAQLVGIGEGPAAEAYSPARLDALRAADRPVFVNLTAAWCITCHVNERVALSSSRIADAFASRGIAYLKGDWTSRDPEITKLLAAHGRSGVPLYLMYPPGGGAAFVLPQLLTEAIVLEAVEPLPATAALASSPERRS